MALTVKGKKKRKKGGAKKQQDDKKKDMNTVKCFGCHEIGHYADTCLNNNKKKQQIAASAEIDDFTAIFQSEFSRCTGKVERERENPFSPLRMLTDRGSFPW